MFGESSNIDGRVSFRRPLPSEINERLSKYVAGGDSGDDAAASDRDDPEHWRLPPIRGSGDACGAPTVFPNAIAFVRARDGGFKFTRDGAVRVQSCAGGAVGGPGHKISLLATFD